MKKLICLLVMLMTLAVCACAYATTFNFQDISAKLEISDDYILLTPDNLDLHDSWVEAQGKTKEEILAQWEEQGVLLIAESTDGDVQIWFTAVQDEDAQTYYDLDQQSEATRKQYMNSFLKSGSRVKDGYTYSSSEWKKKDQYGRFLALKYKRLVGSTEYRGYMRKAIRNGYTITVDYRVISGRNLKNKDLNNLDTVMNSFAFTQVNQKPASCTPKATFEETPPSETCTGKFSVSGVADTGLQIIGVMTRYSTGDYIRYEAESNEKNGKFSIDVQLPDEGVWLMTLTFVNDTDEVTEEVAFGTTTYTASLLPVNFDTVFDPTFEWGTDELVISGTTIRGVSIQCIVDSSYDKTVKTNGTGRFSFKIPTKTEGSYGITIVFSKKGYDTRRFTYTANRVITEEDTKNAYRSEAIKPSYSTLNNKLTGYTGRVMKYTLYLVDKQQVGDLWVLTMAMQVTKSGGYKSYVAVVCSEEPNLLIGGSALMYGRCTGAYELTVNDETMTVPGFELLFWD